MDRAFWESLTGSKVGGGHLLRELIGCTEESAVYRIPYGEPGEQAVLKLSTASGGAAEVVRVEHPLIVQLFASGTCEVEGAALRYFVMEAAEENLGTVVAARALSADETRETLRPALEALAYLHERGLAHTRVTPSNILAVGDGLKLSADSIRPVGAAASEEEDLRALGLTIIEMLTQERQPSAIAQVPQPFLDIVEHALAVEPEGRWTARQAALRLSGAVPGGAVPVATAAVATPAVEPRPEEAPARVKPVGVKRPVPVWVYAAVAVTLLVAVSAVLTHGTGSSSAAQNPEPAPVRQEVAPAAPTPAPVLPRVEAPPHPPKPTPFEARTPESPKSAVPAAHGWFVVSASYVREADAAQMARQMARRWPQFKPSVFPPSPIDSHYLVILGSGLSEAAADALRQRAVHSGLPADTYIKMYPARR